jgi:hypothetical protein
VWHHPARCDGEVSQLGSQLDGAGGSSGDAGIAEAAPPASTADPLAAATLDAIGASGPPPPVFDDPVGAATYDGCSSLLALSTSPPPLASGAALFVGGCCSSTGALPCGALLPAFGAAHPHVIP